MKDPTQMSRDELVQAKLAIQNEMNTRRLKLIELSRINITEKLGSDGDNVSKELVNRAAGAGYVVYVEVPK